MLHHFLELLTTKQQLMELSKETYLRIFNEAVKYGISIKDHPSADHYLEGAKAEALRSQQLVEALERAIIFLEQGQEIDPGSPLHDRLKSSLRQYNNLK